MLRRAPLLLVAFSACGSPGAPEPPATAAVCGDGVPQAGEECDDGNADDADACLRTCEAPARFVASDPHIHGHGCGGDLGPEELLERSAARGIEVTTALVWGEGYGDDRRFFSGRDDPASRAGALLHYELEVSHFPAAQTGHLLIYGLRSIDFSPSPFTRPRSGLPVNDWARAQGAQVVVGMAHGEFWPDSGRYPAFPETCCMPYDFLPEAVRGRLAFLGTEQRDGLPALDARTAFLHRKALNAGARVALTGASDFPCINHTLTFNTIRTDVLLDDGPVTYDRWLNALQRGRTTVAIGRGTRLNMRVQGARLGDEVRATAGDTLKVTIESRLPSVAEIRILANGTPAVVARVPAGPQAAAFKLQVDRSVWLQAVSSWVATSPIYVVVDDRPIRGAPSEICYVTRYVDHLIRGVSGSRLDLGSETDAALAAYREVRAELQRRFSEAGGGVCP
ncbi:MAG TPA: CehA/McbA family metallohydrolase [Vicinamibacteria bacterium]|nr:CehA/McbA family metallohydrolase [Vicinamibacteria bacterium]